MATYEPHPTYEADNERKRQMDEEWQQACFVREHEHRFAFCRYLIASGRLTDHPITPTSYRVATHPNGKADES